MSSTLKTSKMICSYNKKKKSNLKNKYWLMKAYLQIYIKILKFNCKTFKKIFRKRLNKQDKNLINWILMLEIRNKLSFLKKIYKASLILRLCGNSTRLKNWQQLQKNYQLFWWISRRLKSTYAIFYLSNSRLQFMILQKFYFKQLMIMISN